jgi:methylisocitrate lyase
VTWLTPGDGEHATAAFARIVEGDETVVVPGIFNGLTALLAAKAGARALYLSGAAFSASMGLPDVGLVTLDELVRAMRQIARATRVPTIVDADTGFGGPLNVMRTVRELEGAGAAAVQVEDQEDPKRCGHLEGKVVTDVERMVEKVRAAATARRDLRVIARTDARATHGFDEAVARGRAYRGAGADVIFPEALETEDELSAYASAVDAPLLANMTEFGRSPMLSAERLAELGYRLVVFPVSAARVAAKQVERFYAELLRDGVQTRWLDRMLTREELYGLIGYDAYAELDRSLSRTDRDD